MSLVVAWFFMCCVTASIQRPSYEPESNALFSLQARSPRRSPQLSHSAAASQTPMSDESAILRGILHRAKVDDARSVLDLMHKNGITATDLMAERSDARAEAMLQRAGILLSDCVKIVRALRGQGSNGSAGGGSSSSGSSSTGASLPPAAGGCLGCLCRLICAPCRCLLSLSPFKSMTMKCGLIMYSSTVLIVTLTVLSFYLPAMLYQVRSNNRRIGSHFLQPAQANFLMPSAAGGRFAGLGGGGHGVVGRSQRSVMMVTANQPLPCTTRRGDWIMELALRNKLMYATLHDYKTWWSTEL